MPALTIDEWRDGSNERARKLSARPDSEFQRMATIAVARKADTVVNHEGWQTFLDHLGTMRDNLRGFSDDCAKRAALTNLWGDALAEMKTQARMAKAGADAYQAAMDLIPALIERGHVAQGAQPQSESPADGPTGKTVRSDHAAAGLTGARSE